MSADHIAPRSAFSGKYCTHIAAREDAVIHMGREFVPTTNETKYVSSLAEMIAAGGTICFNEDQTEIYLTLPVGHKFSIKALDTERAAPDLLAALRSVVFQADSSGDGTETYAEITRELVDKARAAIAKARQS